MKCPYCGADNPEDAVCCTSCEKQLHQEKLLNKTSYFLIRLAAVQLFLITSVFILIISGVIPAMLVKRNRLYPAELLFSIFPSAQQTTVFQKQLSRCAARETDAYKNGSQSLDDTVLQLQQYNNMADESEYGSMVREASERAVEEQEYLAFMNSTDVHYDRMTGNEIIDWYQEAKKFTSFTEEVDQTYTEMQEMILASAESRFTELKEQPNNRASSDHDFWSIIDQLIGIQEHPMTEAIRKKVQSLATEVYKEQFARMTGKEEFFGEFGTLMLADRDEEYWPDCGLMETADHDCRQYLEDQLKQPQTSFTYGDLLPGLEWIVNADIDINKEPYRELLDKYKELFLDTRLEETYDLINEKRASRGMNELKRITGLEAFAETLTKDPGLWERDDDCIQHLEDAAEGWTQAYWIERYPGLSTENYLSENLVKKEGELLDPSLTGLGICLCFDEDSTNYLHYSIIVITD